MSVETNELYSVQEELERQSIEITSDRYKKALKDMENRGRAGETKPVILLISRATEGLAKAIDEWIDPKDKSKGWNAGRKATTRSVLRELDLTSFELAFCTLKVLFNHVVSEKTDMAKQTAVCMSLAEQLEHETNYRRFKKEQPQMLRAIQTHVKHLGTFKQRELEFVEKAMLDKHMRLCIIEQEDKLRLGHKLLELAIEHTGMFVSRKIRISRNKSPFIIQVSEEVTKFIEESSDLLAFFTPTYRPMIVPPVNWTSLYTGGYLSVHPKWKPDLIRRMSIKHHRDLAHEKLTKVKDAVNVAQQTKWTINTDVLDIIKELWFKQGGGVADLPNADPIELPPRPWDKMSKDEWIKFKKENKELVSTYSKKCADIHTMNREMASKRLALVCQIQIAEDYSKYKEIYFPWNLDFRGRMYPIPTTLNPQANDIGKGLLKFANGHRLTQTGRYWWKVGCANAWGEDKVPFNSRVEWFDNNKNMIFECGHKPLESQEWTNADNPFQFLAFCLEYANGSGISHLPVNMDGTCNGLQHLSAMLKDEVGGKAVNLLDSNEPQDIYGEVAEKLSKILEADTNPLSDVWKPIVNRKLVKTGTMNTPYGVSEYGLKDQILDQAKENLDGYTVDKFRASVYLADRLGEAIKSVVVGAKNTMDWFDTLVEESDQLFLKWRTPLTDFPVIQNYQKTKKKRVNLFIGSQRIQLHLHRKIDYPAEGKQKSGFSPNFVHSIDACMLMETLSRLFHERNVREFSLIHDSYGTHANYIEDLHEILRQVFVDIYKNGDILQSIKSQLGGSTEPPKLGELDLEEVLKSKYFFH